METDTRQVGEFDKALSVDQHGIEPIPDVDRDSTAWQQFWIWLGANISPLFWVAGAIGPQLGLSLVQSIVIMVVGQALGALIFGVFALMGRSLVALLVGLVSGWAFEYGTVSPFQGPIARATNGLDLSWLASIVFGGSTYWWLSRSEPDVVSPPSLLSVPK